MVDMYVDIDVVVVYVIECFGVLCEEIILFG